MLVHKRALDELEETLTGVGDVKIESQESQFIDPLYHKLFRIRGYVEDSLQHQEESGLKHYQWLDTVFQHGHGKNELRALWYKYSLQLAELNQALGELIRALNDKNTEQFSIAKSKAIDKTKQTIAIP